MGCEGVRKGGGSSGLSNIVGFVLRAVLTRETLDKNPEAKNSAFQCKKECVAALGATRSPPLPPRLPPQPPKKCACKRDQHDAPHSDGVPWCPRSEAATAPPSQAGLAMPPPPPPAPSGQGSAGDIQRGTAPRQMLGRSGPPAPGRHDPVPSTAMTLCRAPPGRRGAPGAPGGRRPVPRITAVRPGGGRGRRGDCA